MLRLRCAAPLVKRRRVALISECLEDEDPLPGGNGASDLVEAESILLAARCAVQVSAVGLLDVMRGPDGTVAGETVDQVEDSLGYLDAASGDFDERVRALAPVAHR